MQLFSFINTNFAPFVKSAQEGCSFTMVHLEGVPACAGRHAATFQVGFDSWKVIQDKSAKLVNIYDHLFEKKH